MTTDLVELLRDRIGTVPVPPSDLAVVERAGRRIRRRRTGSAAAVVAAVAIVVLAVSVAVHPGGDERSDDGIDPLGPLDFSHGLRAYAAPGAEIHLGGRTFPGSQLQALDTDATATAFGVVFYVDGRPMLLEESGDTRALEPEAQKSGFLPTAKNDAQRPWVAYGATIDGKPTVVVRDLAHGEVVGSRKVPVDTVIDGLDDGVVLLRSAAGTSTWRAGSADVEKLAGPGTRVADVRNGVLLYDGPTPDGPAAAAYRLVPGAIDAQLTFDGGHVLSWSSLLRSTDGGAPITLDRGPTSANGYAFWAIDTDGSVMVAVPGKGNDSTVYDCEVPSGRCETLGPLVTTSGDPMFIGVDM